WARLSERGPNSRGGVLEERDWGYDGLGRLVAEAWRHEIAGGGYAPITVRELTYDTFPGNAGTEGDPRGWARTNFKASRKAFDGLDRVGEAIVALDSNVTSLTDENLNNKEVHKYVYDSRGNLTTVSNPTPLYPSTSADVVSWTYKHDARGR